MSTNGQNQNDDWDEMSSLWQAQDVSVLRDLPKKIRQKTVQMYLIFGAEALIGLFGVVVGFWLLFIKGGDFSIYLGPFIIIAAVSSVACSWWTRRGIWKGQSFSAIDQLELSIKRAKASIKYANYNLMSIVLFLVLFAVFYVSVPDFFSDKYAEKGPQFIIRFGIAVGLMLLVFVGSIFYKTKKKKELGFFRELLHQLKDY